MSGRRHLMIMAAGTGGHVMPGLAVAREMERRGWSLSWLGTTQGMENTLVPPSGIPMDNIAFAGLRGKGLMQTIGGVLRLLGAFWSCQRYIRRRGTDAVLGMGGYVCFPGGLMAALLRRPLVLVNADASLLMSNRVLLPFAATVVFGFDGDAARFTRDAVVTGNPVRPEIAALAEPAKRFTGRSGPLRLLVVGGSLGAKVLNECLPAALALLPEAQRPHVTHQTGVAHLKSVTAGYAKAGMRGELVAFIDDMPRRLAECDVIVCRAGAVTVSELCAGGVAAVLVPLVISTTAHQRDNAQWLAGQGAGVHLPQTDLSPSRLAELLAGLTREDLLAMAAKARLLAKPNAAARVADEIERLVPA